MKKFIQKMLIVFAIALSVNSNAQTTVDLSYIIDSSSVWPYCPAPIPITVYAGGTATGYNPATDSISLHYFWGDGTDTLFKVPLYGSVLFNFGSFDNDHIYTTPGTYAVKVVATGPDGMADSLVNTPFTISSGCVLVDGYSYVDNNSNCVFDSGDDTLSGVPLRITDSFGNVLGYANSDLNGHYVTSIASGLTGLQISPYYTWTTMAALSCPSSGSYTFSSTGGMSFDFGFSCSTAGYDLWVGAHSARVAAPGSSDGWLYFTAGNASCVSSPATITLTLDPNVTYSGILTGPLPTTIVGNVLTWNVSLPPSYFYYGGWFSIGIQITTNTSATLFDTACSLITISPTISDLSIGNNSQNVCRIIGGPYDPNNKEVSPAGIGATGEIAPNTELTYKVNFQNTGTEQAINVSVLDTIDTDLDMSTFRIIASSHTMNPEFYEGNIVRFKYPNIMLPDSNTNEPLSHGWVVYKINTKAGLTSGTQIKNTGHIFFDYNSAIVTNTTLNTINIALGVEENEMQLSTLIYPNPAQDQFTLEFAEPVNGTLSVIDVTGRVVKTIPVNKTDRISVNTQELSSGLYGLSFPGVTLKQNRVQIIK